MERLNARSGRARVGVVRGTASISAIGQARGGPQWTMRDTPGDRRARTAATAVTARRPGLISGRSGCSAAAKAGPCCTPSIERARSIMGRIGGLEAGGRLEKIAHPQPARLNFSQVTEWRGGRDAASTLAQHPAPQPPLVDRNE